jgi:hypothetical protein
VAELAGFPNAANDDQVDGTSMALLRLRSSGATTVHSPAGATVSRAGRGGAGGARTGLTSARPAGARPTLGRSGFAGTRRPR